MSVLYWYNKTRQSLCKLFVCLLSHTLPLTYTPNGLIFGWLKLSVGDVIVTQKRFQWKCKALFAQRYYWTKWSGVLMAFEYLETILLMDWFYPFNYRTSLVIRSPLYYILFIPTSSRMATCQNGSPSSQWFSVLHFEQSQWLFLTLH